MNTWQALKHILGQPGFYLKKFLFFVFLFGLIVVAIYLINRFNFRADELSSNLGTSRFSADYHLYVEKDGEVLINGQNKKRLIRPTAGYDELRFTVVDRLGTSLERVEVTVELPFMVKPKDIKISTIGVHGVGSQNAQVVGSQTINYTAWGIGKDATFTIVAQFPKGHFEYPPILSLWYYFLAQSAVIWLILSGGAGLIAILVLFGMFRHHLKINAVKEPTVERDTLPSELPPALVGVLYDGKIGPRDIAATLIDLARRGYIIIHHKGKDFTFGKTKLMDSPNPVGLAPFEKVLLSKIFTEESFKSSREDIEVRIGHHLFSRKVAEVYLNIYDIVTGYGFFNENPRQVHQKYKAIGLAFFFLSIVGFILTIIYGSDPKYPLFFWFAIMLAGTIITSFSSLLMPIRTVEGNEILREWLSLKLYIERSDPIPFDGEINEKFSKLLPYAISLELELDWVNRFLPYPFYPPSWFSSNDHIDSIEDFANALFPLIGYVGGSLASSRERIVD